MPPRKEIDVLRDKLDGGERGGDEADRDLLLDFSDELELLRSEYSDHRHLKLLRHCTRMSEHGGSLADALEEKDAAEDIVRWIHRTYDNEETNRDYRIAFRVFGKRVAGKTVAGQLQPPESLAWISGQTSRNYNPAPDRADMLEYNPDVQRMLENTVNPRDEALIALAFEAGLRGQSELYELTVGNITDSKHGKRVRVDGKTGERSVDLIIAVPHLNKWLADHPARGDDDCALWTHLNEPEQISYNRYLQCFRETAERAGVYKPVTPTNFRKSNAFWLARQGKSQAFIEDRQGRTRGSKVIARYVAEFGEEDMTTQYAAMHGLDVEPDDTEDNAPVSCPRCKKETPAHRPFCMWCDQALDYDAREDLEGDARDLELAFMKLAQARPELLQDAEVKKQMLGHVENPDVVERLEAMSELID